MTVSWFKEPIVLFFAAGAILFVWQSLDQDENIIVVDEPILVRFIENRTKNFSGSISARFEKMSEEAKADVIQQYVREEALHRHALKLGLDQEDYVIRQRLVQRMEYMSEVADVEDPEENELREYYDKNQEEFFVEPVVTFTHVFFRPSEGVMTVASESLERLNRERIPFEKAPQHGQRFNYQLNYVEKSRQQVASHFGGAFASQVFQLEPGDVWQGPVESEYGLHNILLTHRTRGTTAPFETAREQIRGRLIVLRQRGQQEERINSIVSQYEVDVRTSTPGESF